MKKILFCLIPLLLVSCTINDDVVEDLRDYSDYSEFSLSSIDQLYTKEEGNYIVEIFFPECPHCKAIKSNIFDYLDLQKNNSEMKKLYFFDIRSSSSLAGNSNRDKFKTKPENYSNIRDILIDEMRGAKPSTLEETYFFGTPSLYEINNNSFFDLYVGSTNITNYLASIS